MNGSDLSDSGQVCGHVRGFAPAELRLVLAAFAGHGQALWLRPGVQLGGGRAAPKLTGHQDTHP